MGNGRLSDQTLKAAKTNQLELIVPPEEVEKDKPGWLSGY